jgi:predicted ester cyclase
MAWSAFYEIIAPDIINRTVPSGVPKGPEWVMYFFNNFLQPAFPDLPVELQRQVAENDVVTTHKVFHVSYKGDFMGIPGNGKNITVELMDIIRLENGKFVEYRNVPDWQQVISQLTS